MIQTIFRLIFGRSPEPDEDKLTPPNHITFIRRVIDSCKMEIQIDSAINWVYELYRKGYYSTVIFHELMSLAMYKEEAIMKEKVNKEFIWPHLKKRADEIIEEERRKNFRLIKTETKQVQ